MKNFDWNKHIKEALDRTEFMALSTVGEDGSWVCPLQFSYDEKLTLYFKSMPNSKHMQNIRGNPETSVAIFSTTRLPDRNVTGIQLKGKATILHMREDVKVAAKYHYSRSKPNIDYTQRIDEHLDEDAVWNFVKFVPDEAWYFDTRFFDEESHGRQKIPLEQLLVQP